MRLARALFSRITFGGVCVCVPKIHRREIFFAFQLLLGKANETRINSAHGGNVNKFGFWAWENEQALFVQMENWF